MSARDRKRKKQAPAFPDDFLPAHFHRIASLLNARLLERLRIHGVTVPRWRVLMALVIRDGRTIGELVDYTIIAQPVLSKIIDQMVRDRLVRRQTAQRDSRVVEVYVTAHGRRLYGEIAPAASRHAQLTVRSLTATQQKDLVGFLRVVTQNLSEASSVEAEERAIAGRSRRPGRKAGAHGG